MWYVCMYGTYVCVCMNHPLDISFYQLKLLVLVIILDTETISSFNDKVFAIAVLILIYALCMSDDIVMA